MDNQRASITDVAKLARVSIATVSRVVNKRPSVNKRNLQRVEAAIAELKYRPNVSAQRLASRVNYAVGLTIVRQPIFMMAERAVRVLYEMINSRQAVRLRTAMEPELVVRDSCVAPS